MALSHLVNSPSSWHWNFPLQWAGNTKGVSITVPLTSCLTGLDYSVLQIKTKIVSCHIADCKPIKQEINGTVILPPLVFPAETIYTLVFFLSYDEICLCTMQLSYLSSGFLKSMGNQDRCLQLVAENFRPLAHAEHWRLRLQGRSCHEEPLRHLGAIISIFYGHNLRILVISKNVCPWQAFPA